MKRQETGLFLPAMLVFIIGLAVSLHSWAGAWQSWPQVGKTTLTCGPAPGSRGRRLARPP